ncbi:MAG: hypothetical protein HY255_12610 [Betaproteobacteria bacterium]|nr:hypothetical protein [Betaproteobacteria bacterium]
MNVSRWMGTAFTICMAALSAFGNDARAAENEFFAFDVELQQAGKILGKPHFVTKAGENFVIAVSKDVAVGCFPTPEGKAAVQLTCAIKTFAPGSGGKGQAQTELIVLRLELGKKSNTKLGSTHADIVMVVTASKAGS